MFRGGRQPLNVAADHRHGFVRTKFAYGDFPPVAAAAEGGGSDRAEIPRRFEVAGSRDDPFAAVRARSVTGMLMGRPDPPPATVSRQASRSPSPIARAARATKSLTRCPKGDLQVVILRF